MITKFKLFETRLQDVPFYRGEPSDKQIDSDFKYKVGDIVIFKELNKHYIIKHLNLMSPNQDYYIVNPLDVTDSGWALEEEVDEPDVKSDNYKNIIIKKDSEKYNL